MGALRPFLLKEQRLSTTHEKERTLTKQIGREVEAALPGVEVLAVELSNPERFTVFVDHAEGVDHALCARVTDVLREYQRDYAIDVAQIVRLPDGIAAPLEEARNVMAEAMADNCGRCSARNPATGLCSETNLMVRDNTPGCIMFGAA